jgi:hypothetical protein
MYKSLSALFFIVILLSGCTGMRLVDNQVSSFAPHPPAADASYRFERLPSQQAEAQQQDQLETMTEQALVKVGLKRNDSAAQLLAQVRVTERVERSSADTMAFGWYVGRRVGHHGGLGLGGGPLFPGLAELSSYWREIHLTLREIATQAVVFESRARHEGPWSDSAAILPAMLDAALQDFPRPPSGERRVVIEIRR